MRGLSRGSHLAMGQRGPASCPSPSRLRATKLTLAEALPSPWKVRPLAGAAGDFPGMLRTPTFTISSPTLWYRVAGAGEAFIVIDSHRMIAGPLHGGTKQKFNAGHKFVWQSRDLHGYIGERGARRIHAQCESHIIWRSPPSCWQTRPRRSRAVSTRNYWRRSRRSRRNRRANWPTVIKRSPAESSTCSGKINLPANRGASLDATAATRDIASTSARAVFANWILQHAAALTVQEPSHGTDDKIARLAADRAAHRAKLKADIQTSDVAMAMLDGNGIDEHVLIRGSHKTPGDLAPRRFLEAIDGPNQAPIVAGSGRLELARRITDPAEPFVSRVMVNRVWEHLFGRGIVASVDNFGVLGDKPDNPALLDYLAGEFVHDGWSMKRLIRRIMLSSAYRMSSAPSARSLEVDSKNLLWQHTQIRRLEGEAIRDSMLQISGRLDRRQFGPSVEVYLTSFMDGRGKPASGPLDGNGRRSIYFRVRRNFLSPMMTAFDTPLPFSTVGRRTVSNLPAQALILLNDPLVVEQAHAWAHRLLSDTKEAPLERIRGMYETAFARTATSAELAAAEDFLQEQGKELGLSAGRLPDRRTRVGRLVPCAVQCERIHIHRIMTPITIGVCHWQVKSASACARVGVPLTSEVGQCRFME